MINRRDLIRALNRRGVADWVLVQRDQELATAEELPQLRRAEKRLKWQLTMHHDTPAGRGSAHVTLDAADGNAEAAVEQAFALAVASIGPSWISSPLAAPARVKLEDTGLAKRDPVEVAVSMLRGLERPSDAQVVATASYMREQVSVASRQGLRTDWIATHVRIDALVTAGTRSLAITREARQLVDLDVGSAIRDSVQDLQLLATASAPVGGPCELVLGTEAMLHGGLGVWVAFASQANAVVERQGLTRYLERKPIAPDAHQISDALTISSDGALDHGVLSAPVGDEGDAIRRFMLVERGIAAGFGLSPREAALRKRDPNGGVRNLVVAPGTTWAGAITPGTTRVVEIKRLRSLSIDPYTGDASLEIALGIDHDKGASKPFTGGSIRIDLIATLARATRSTKAIRRGAYQGPHAVWIDRAELIA